LGLHFEPPYFEVGPAKEIWRPQFGGPHWSCSYHPYPSSTRKERRNAMQCNKTLFFTISEKKGGKYSFTGIDADLTHTMKFETYFISGIRVLNLLCSTAHQRPVNSGGTWHSVQEEPTHELAVKTKCTGCKRSNRLSMDSM
jgi:hypothetical protein